MTKPAQQGSLGRAVLRSRSQKNHSQNNASKHSRNLQDGTSWSLRGSITEQSDLQELLQVAELSHKDFTSERGLPSFVSDRDARPFPKDAFKPAAAPVNWLCIPRRPKWSRQMSADDLHILEEESFLEWRRGLAKLEDSASFIITPFERNLEIWRQLWIVVEHCGLIVLILDARNPLLFYCSDLERYLKELDTSKSLLLLLNKSDFLSAEQRLMWAEYFESKDLEFAFYSAKHADEALEEVVEDAAKEDGSEDEDDEEDDEDEEDDAEDEEDDDDDEEEEDDDDDEDDEDDDKNDETDIQLVENLPEDARTALLTRADFLKLLKEKSCGRKVGFVGFPNVGKSSTINSLIGQKKVAVASTPGKTKHFQTIVLESIDLTLYDCPGLVFPNLAASKADLVLNGILPIDQLRDYVGPVELLVSKVPLDIIYKHYGLKQTYSENARFEKPAMRLLEVIAASRGFRTSFHGNPDCSRSSRIILKEFVDGSILFCTPPPDSITPDLFNKYPTETQSAEFEDFEVAEQKYAPHEKLAPPKEVGYVLNAKMRGPKLLSLANRQSR